MLLTDYINLYYCKTQQDGYCQSFSNKSYSLTGAEERQRLNAQISPFQGTK